MPRTVIVGYRPKPGKQAALDALMCTHFARLYEQGLVTRRRPIMMRARDGTVLEVFEWKFERAIDEAHANPAVLAMWGEYAEVCDYVPVGEACRTDSSQSTSVRRSALTSTCSCKRCRARPKRRSGCIARRTFA